MDIKLSKKTVRTFGLILGSCSLAGTSLANGGGSLSDAISSGKVTLDMRYRLEMVDQDNPLDDATASTLRTRLGFKPSEYKGFQLFLEVENILPTNDGYNSLNNGQTHYSVVADSEETEINRAYVSYSGITDTVLSFGRQRIILDNARHVGNVGWRQNEQTFDALTLVNKSISDTEITLGYIDKVHRIFGDAHPNGDTDMQSPIFNAVYKGVPSHSLSAYGYLLDYVDQPQNSQATWGVRVSGNTSLSKTKFLYTAEYATQGDYKDGAADIDADYLHLVGGIKIAKTAVSLGYEVLGSDGNYAFQTPLATGHAFNGWADLFLTTPIDGLQDKYITLGTELSGFKLKAIFHDFTSDNGNLDYGSEVNLLVTRKFGKRYSAGLKYANYQADSFSVDTQKVQLFGQFKFD